jgi:hypothetical protein
MGFLEDRWQRRMEERPPTPAEEAEEARRARDAERAALEAELAPIMVSTLSTDARPFEQQGVVQGEPAENADWALLNLKQAARSAECDAVLGVGFCAVPIPAGADPVMLASGLPSFPKIAHQVFAYGTGVRWLS